MKWFIQILFVVTSLGVMNSARAEISLNDLGLSTKDFEITPKQMLEQKTLEKRHSMLKTHETLGLATLGLMTATMFTGGSAIGSNTHMYLGMTTGLLYFTTAYYSLSAPKPAGIKDRGNIVWHKRLAWIHFPAMVLAPVLGYIYKKNEEEGRKSSSLVKQHSAVAGVGYGAFAISAALMTIEF